MNLEETYASLIGALELAQSIERACRIEVPGLGALEIAPGEAWLVTLDGRAHLLASPQLKAFSAQLATEVHPLANLRP